MNVFMEFHLVISVVSSQISNINSDLLQHQNGEVNLGLKFKKYGYSRVPKKTSEEFD